MPVATGRNLGPMIAITDPTTLRTVIGRYPGGPTQLQAWYAESQDRVPGTDVPLWRFDRVEVESTPWMAIYTPTEQEVGFSSLAKCRRFAAEADALDFLRRLALAEVKGVAYEGIRLAGLDRRPDRIKVRQGELARRQLAILTGAVLTFGAAHPDARCECGGMLVAHAAGWRHIDACDECWRGPVERWSLPCHLGRTAHTVCATPEPLSCQHYGCHQPENLQAQPCGRGLASCCTCCHE